MKNEKGFVLSTYVYMLLVFFLLLLSTMLAVLNNTKLLSNKLKESSSTSSGLTNNEFNIVLLGDKEITILLDEEYIDPGYAAKTVSGTDISGNVDVIGEVNTSQIGDYILTYRITHDGKTKELERKVRVVDNKAVNYINELYLNAKQKNGLIKDDTVDQNIRYVGSNPRNKVYFNCKDTHDGKTYGSDEYDYDSACEEWRIIGVFDTKSTDSETETPVKRVKIVRDEFSTRMSWDSSASNGGYGINQWAEIRNSSGDITYEGSDLMRMLNGYYIRKSDMCIYCNGNNQEECPTTNDCTNTITPLSIISLNMIEDALWYLGSPTKDEILTLLMMYEGERSIQTGKICSSGNQCNDSIGRTTTWVGKIGLIYPSDYAYASTNEGCASDIYGSDSTCNINNWLYPKSGSYWSISPSAISGNANFVWYAHSINHVTSNFARHTLGVRPSLYLSPNVKIAGGNGGGEPYKLKI